MAEGGGSAAGDAVARCREDTAFAELFAAEGRHFWFRARNKAIAALAGPAASRSPARLQVLEAGCGTGNVLGVLCGAYPGSTVVGMDLSPDGLRFARRRTPCSLVAGDVSALPFSRPFDVVCLFDVLEHVEDDLGVLRSLHALLSPGGILLLAVPAHPSLWSYFDEASHHYRRYALDELKGKLDDAGYCVEYATYYMTGILPAVWLARRLRSLRRGRDARSARDMASSELRVIPGVNGLLSLVLSFEAPLIARGRHLPAGTSVLARARRVAATDQPGSQ